MTRGERMRPDVVVDIGNTRIKWGWGEPLQMASLSPDDPSAWDDHLARLPAVIGPHSWAMAGVHPDRLARLKSWAEARGDTVRVVGHADIPLAIDVDEPHRVGIDRLFGALAARSMAPPGTPVITVDVGTAVTVNLVDAAGAFRGGAIFPGPRLMALALDQHTAKLPLVEVTESDLRGEPARNTAAAIRLGISDAVRGGAYGLVSAFAGRGGVPAWVFLTGGGAGLLSETSNPAVARVVREPALNLIGIRLAAGTVPG